MSEDTTRLQVAEERLDKVPEILAALFVGKDDDDTLILQVREAEPSVIERFATNSPFNNHDQRVVEGQRLMQAVSDISWDGTASVKEKTENRTTTTYANCGIGNYRPTLTP